MTLMKLSYFLTLFSYNNLIYYFLNLLRLLFRFPRYDDSTFLTVVNKKKKKESTPVRPGVIIASMQTRRYSRPFQDQSGQSTLVEMPNAQ